MIFQKNYRNIQHLKMANIINKSIIIIFNYQWSLAFFFHSEIQTNTQQFPFLSFVLS